MSSWAEDKAHEWAGRWECDKTYTGDIVDAVTAAIRETIEEAARRCRAEEDACMEPGAALGAGRCARAIEAMLEPEVKR